MLDWDFTGKAVNFEEKNMLDSIIYLITNNAGVFFAAQHDFLPRLSGGRSEQDQEGLGESLEVVVAVDVGPFLRRNLAKHLNWRENPEYCISCSLDFC